MNRTEAISRLQSQISKGYVTKQTLAAKKEKIAKYEAMTDEQYEAHIANFMASIGPAGQAAVIRMIKEI
jgi:hypothetical protein